MYRLSLNVWSTELWVILQSEITIGKINSNHFLKHRHDTNTPEIQLCDVLSSAF